MIFKYAWKVQEHYDSDLGIGNCTRGLIYYNLTGDSLSV